MHWYSEKIIHGFFMTQVNILHVTAITALVLWFIMVYLLTMNRLVRDAHIDRKQSQQVMTNYTIDPDASLLRNAQSIPKNDNFDKQMRREGSATVDGNSDEQFLGYAVLSSDHHLEYLFPLPIVALAWRRLNIDSLVLLIGTEQQYESDVRLKFVLDHLKRLRVRYFFLHSTMLDTFTLAQVGRLFVAALEGLDLPNSAILITADADMISFNFSNHIPDLRAGKKVFLYNSACCGMMQHVGENDTFSHIPMNTIAMTVELWREVMGIAPDSFTSGDYIANRLYAEFGKEAVTGNGAKDSDKWYMDQKLISSLLHQWIGKRESNKLLIGEKMNHGFRYDRIDWPISFEGETLVGKDDAHLLHPLYGSFWNRTIGLLKLMFDEKDLVWCTDYQKGFLILTCPSCFSRFPVFATRFFLAFALLYSMWRMRSTKVCFA